jgi:hypothetical protein
MTDILCPTCGRPNPDNQATCDFCGSPIKSEELDRLDDLLSPQEPPEEVSRLEDLIPKEEPKEPAPKEPPLPDDFSLRDELEDESPDDSSRLDEILFDQDLTEPLLEERIQPAEPVTPEKPSSETPEIPKSEPEEIPEESTPESEEVTPPLPDIFHDEHKSLDDSEQTTDSLDDFETESMSPGFGDSGWLEMLQEPESSDQPDIDPTVGPAQVKKKETDWLEKIKRLNKSAELVDDDSSFPDWLSVSEKAPPEEPEQPQPEQPPPTDIPPSEDVPEWLQMDADDQQLSEFFRRKDLTKEEIKPDISPSSPPVEEEGAGDPSEPPTPGDETTSKKKFPSWAGDEADPSLEEDQQIPKGLEFLAGIDPTKTAGRAVDPFQIEDELFDDLFSEELPNWLTSASDGEIIIQDDELAVGELPGWVEAMRPVVESSDATGLSEDEEYIENYGPLAGIPSVLPAEAETVLDPEQAVKKPLELTATKIHQDYVSVLRKLIANESKSKEIKKSPVPQTQRVLRWLISIILLVTTAGTVIFGGSFQAEIPTPIQVQKTGYGALHREISYLGEGQPVLIAFDYQPAATGELHFTAASVVDHIMSQGAYLSFVSTQPTGPALAEYFLVSTQEKHEYRHNLEYINLGYLPGESAGLVSFMIAPKKIIPLAFDGSNAWGSPPLINVNSINDFGMILVITDDPNTAKIWIEQIGVNLVNTPLMMVVSAQVEPLIQPYFLSSPQLLSGYVSGVIDSLNYESLVDEPNLATISWLPFNVGIFITVATIFIGGLANGFMSLFTRHRSKRKGALK